MGFFGKKKVAPKGGEGYSDRLREEEGLPKNVDAPWALAQMHHDDRFLRLAAHARNWRNFAFFTLILAAGAVVGIAYIGAQSKIKPYLVEVDKLGRTIAVRSVDGRDAILDSKRMVYREMIELIENARTVTGDFAANNKALTYVFSRLKGAAYTYVKTELTARKPNEVATSRTIVVDVHTALPVTEDTWQVEWTETSFNLKGEKMPLPERWKANIHFELQPGGSEADLKRNPVGFEVPSMSWTRQM